MSGTYTHTATSMDHVGEFTLALEFQLLIRSFSCDSPTLHLKPDRGDDQAVLTVVWQSEPTPPLIRNQLGNSLTPLTYLCVCEGC